MENKELVANIAKDLHNEFTNISDNSELVIMGVKENGVLNILSVLDITKKPNNLNKVLVGSVIVVGTVLTGAALFSIFRDIKSKKVSKK